MVICPQRNRMETKGYHACPICMGETTCVHLLHQKKLCQTGHHRFLPIDHPWCQERKPFDDNVDFKNPVVSLSGKEILEQVHNIEVYFGKTNEQAKARKRKLFESGLDWTKKSYFFDLPYWADLLLKLQSCLDWTKKSYFFELPYWADLLLRHNLDLMHVYKNVSKVVIATIMDIDNKTKDHQLCRQYLMDLGLTKDQHLIPNGDSYIMPHACYCLTKTEKKKVYAFLASVKYPDGLQMTCTDV